MAESPQQQSPRQQSTLWTKTKNYSGTAYTNALKPGFDKVYTAIDKLGPHVNRLSNKVGGEAFWATTLDIESEKAARILRSFCKDGLYDKIEAEEIQRVADKAEKERTNKTGFVPKGKSKAVKKIPTKAIQNAKALVIFTTMRTAWIIGGAGGAGVIVARHPETGEWSPPSGIHMHNYSIGFMGGVDIIDTVLVINSYKALEAFTKTRCTLGTEVGLAAGPYGIGGTIDTKVTEKPAPVWSYVKNRGAFAGIGIDGNIIIERTDENARFYGETIGVSDILLGKVRNPPYDQYKVLIDTVRAAQGESIDESLLPSGVTPSDMDLAAGPIFGVPAEDDPDPFGVKALEAEGFAIREAGTHRKASAEAFEFKPSPTSPIFSTYRRSLDQSSLKREWRGSQHSLASHHSHYSVDRGTQTDDDDLKGSLGIKSPDQSHIRNSSSPVRDSQPTSPQKSSPELNSVLETNTMLATSPKHSDDSHDELSDVESDVEISMAEAAVARPKAGVVTVPRRIAPALPPRNPSRVNAATLSKSAIEIPATESFEQISLHGGEDGQKQITVEPSDESMVAGTIYNPEEQFHSTPSSPGVERPSKVPGAF